MDYTFKLSDLAIIFATILGPILAVQAQKAVERWRESHSRREAIFKTLMATRAARLAPEHIQALNMISIEFPPNKQFKRVRSAWKAYFTHLGEPLPNESQQPVYFAKRAELFTDLLYEMGMALKFDFDKTEISKEVYSTIYHEKAELDANIIRAKLAQILNGEATFPMAVHSFPQDPIVAEHQAEYLKLMVELLRQGKAMPVSIVDNNSSSHVVAIPRTGQLNAESPKRSSEDA